jgi:phospholipase C
MLGFLEEEENSFGTTIGPISPVQASRESLNFISMDLIPVYNTIAQNFVLSDTWFADVGKQL